MNKKFLIVLSLVAFASSGSFAVEKKVYKKMRYGMAGCGLGSLFVEKNHVLPQIGAWFLNGTGIQTFGITTGSSNCLDKERNDAKIEQEVFVQTNFAKLSIEAAQGTGEHLDALAEVLGCEGASLARLSQDRYGKIFTQDDPKAVLQNYVREIRASELATSCSRLVG
jgi:hypothetical protein